VPILMHRLAEPSAEDDGRLSRRRERLLEVDDVGVAHRARHLTPTARPRETRHVADVAALRQRKKRAGRGPGPAHPPVKDLYLVAAPDEFAREHRRPDREWLVLEVVGDEHYDAERVLTPRRFDRHRLPRASSRSSARRSRTA